MTGAEIHVVSLYFLPLVLAGLKLGRAASLGVSLFSTLVWLAALYENGAGHASPSVWVINFVTQGMAFVTVTLLVSRLNSKLGAERAMRRNDPLTGLSNRQGFIERAGFALPLCSRHKRPVGLAFIDLDNFKLANDRLGHAGGDDLLRQCGEIITGAVRASDIAARLGGDEFVILLPETGDADALDVCQRVLRAIEGSVTFGAAGVSASIGVVVDESASASIEDLLARADAEMYRVKRQRKQARMGAGPPAPSPPAQRAAGTRRACPRRGEGAGRAGMRRSRRCLRR